MTHGIAVGPARRHDLLVGRGDELASLEDALGALEGGRSRAIELVGEPGIGKTRLLRELASRAEVRGHLVLSGSASELERDLPFAVFVDALDEYVEGLDQSELSALDHSVRAELAHVFPSLSACADGQEVALQHERYRSHRATRALLERLAESGPLVLALDDLHWADPAAVELIGALLRRPPAAPVLLALALRPHQTPRLLRAALEHAHRAAALTRLELVALTRAESVQLLGEAVSAADASALYRESGGNPFYLEQLARSRAPAAGTVPEVFTTVGGVPAAVAASLNEELALLTDGIRVVLDGAAVAGDPFEPELAAAAAAVSEAAATDAIDELLEHDLVRTTEVPRRFRFRHPLVRRAVYEASAGGWRLGAHERCAAKLATRGAAAPARAHHVEYAARMGDPGAVAVLREAGESVARLAPQSAARWFAAALRLLPERAQPHERVELLLDRAEALAACGHFAESHEALLEGLATLREEPSPLRTVLTTACARTEHRLGQYEAAHARLATALSSLPERVSAESVALLIELALNEFYRSNYESMHEWAERAADAAETLGDRPLEAAALAMPALADAMNGAGDRARANCTAAAAVVDGLSDDELSQRLDAGTWLAAGELYLDLYAEADTHASRALLLARATGQEELFLVLHQILGRAWYVRGKLADATQLLDGAIESARLSRNNQALVGSLFNRSVVAVAVGDLDVAACTAEESVELARDLDEGFVAAWSAVRLAGVLLETGEPDRALQLLLSSAGGEELTLIPGGWRAYCLELLTRCLLALDRHADAQCAAEHAQACASAVQLPLACAWAARAAAAVDLAAGEPLRAAEQALSSAEAAGEVGAPLEAAFSRTLAGRALAQAGRRDRAIAELQRAVAELDACGAFRYRDEAERELGKLGQRIPRRTRRGNANGTGIETLTSRELQVARLVADRKTNPQIAAELFLSQKTVESHLRNIFRKIDVASRVEVARAVEHAGRERDLRRPA